MTSIVIYEDNNNLRESLKSLLELSGKYMVAGAYNNCTDVDNQIASLNPDVVLMDVDLPEINGIEAVKRIRQFNTSVQIIMLTIFDDNQNVLQAMFAGASGYLLKKHISEKLIPSINDAMEGGAPMSPSIARMIITNMHHKATTPQQYGLTLRETEVLNLLSTGNSFKMIANQMTISLHTVRTHIKTIYSKLQVQSQTEAVSKAFREKLV